MNIRIGSRKSQLAVKQSHIIIDLLQSSNPDLHFQFVPIITEGDIDMSLPKNDESLKAKFVKEIEFALLENTIDLAIHSLKDLPAYPPKNLIIPFFPTREDPRDCLVSNHPFHTLPLGAHIGTSSLRRMRQLKRLRPDLNITPIRGNINTRIQKMKNGEFDGIVIAYAGIKRLNLEDEVTTIFSLDEIIPAPGQGMLGVQMRENDTALFNALSQIHNKKDACAVEIELELNRRYGGGCHTPFGAYAEIDGKNVHLRFYCFNINPKTEQECEIIIHKTYPYASLFFDLEQDIAQFQKGVISC